eukprot:COSAG05_NODE_14017_length_411_cov_0.429487_2_plen_52_part_01
MIRTASERIFSSCGVDSLCWVFTVMVMGVRIIRFVGVSVLVLRLGRFVLLPP